MGHWEAMAAECKWLDEQLLAAGTGGGYRRNWTVTHPHFAPALDLLLADLPDFAVDDFPPARVMPPALPPRTHRPPIA